MTREEAIKLIEHISIAFVPTDQYGDYDDPQPYEEALEMAIEALQEQSRGCMWVCPNCGLDVHVDYDRCVRCGERREP